jgi:dTDP-4-dehydrorhamnose reductase
MSGLIAITGAEGQLGRSLVKRLGDRALGWSRAACNVASPESVQECLETLEKSGNVPSALINAAAYNAVDAAESDRDGAWRVNVEGPRVLAEACLERGIRFIHISTDYVFGNGPAPTGGWRETDEPQPRSIYAETKRDGERAVLKSTTHGGPHPLVVRTCGLYAAPSATGKRSFVEAILQRAATGQPLRVVNDQRCTPTSVDDLVDALLRLLETDASGLVHVVNSGDCTWFEFAAEILRLAGMDVPITPISSADLNQKALRPSDSHLSTARYEQLTGHQLPTWQAALKSRLQADGRLNTS